MLIVQNEITTRKHTFTLVTVKKHYHEKNERGIFTVGAQSIARLCQNLVNCRRNI
jgi:hypothetical protein